MKRFVTGLFLVGLGWFLHAAYEGSLKDSRRGVSATPSGTPDEISFLYPDGAGGHTQVRFTVTSTYTPTDQQGALAPDEYQTVHWFRPVTEEGRIAAVTYRGPKVNR